MWSEVLARFAKFPAQERVAEVLLEHGFQVNSEGEVVSGTIKIADTEISRAAKVDRRAVDEATATILGDDMLQTLFFKPENVDIPPRRCAPSGTWRDRHNTSRCYSHRHHRRSC